MFIYENVFSLRDPPEWLKKTLIQPRTSNCHRLRHKKTQNLGWQPDLCFLKSLFQLTRRLHYLRRQKQMTEINVVSVFW